MSYEGNFSVQNKTGHTILEVSVSYRNDIGRVHYDSTLRQKSLVDGGSLGPQSFEAQEGINDYWDVHFIIVYPNHAKVRYYRTGKQCNYEKSDAPGECRIILMVDKFSIIMPVTSDCKDNYLETQKLPIA